jgi:mono/diheme cytochrome c family protein
VLLALTGYETALVVVAASFIVFALVVALVVPRSRPSFPGNKLGLFLVVCGLFFVSQLTAVLVLAEKGEADEAVHETTGEESTTPTETQPSEPTQGDAVAGREIFVGSAGCGGCHTLADAGTSGQVGPDLDSVKPTYDKVVTQVTNGGGVMPPFKDTLTEEQIQDVAAYVSSATQG